MGFKSTIENCVDEVGKDLIDYVDFANVVSKEMANKDVDEFTKKVTAARETSTATVPVGLLLPPGFAETEQKQDRDEGIEAEHTSKKDLGSGSHEGSAGEPANAANSEKGEDKSTAE